jgi:SRSO17 transposase
MDFYQRYSGHFVQQGMNSVGHARHYLSGLLGTQRRKNIETIHNDVAQSDYQGMEQFISSSPWCHQALMDQVAMDADELLGDETKTGLFLDESSFLKKGKESVGVQRQWSGRAGKVENCQVGVFACLGKGEHMTITDFRLYLPESWAEDDDRCEKAKVPLEHRIYQPKWRQALEMVRHARHLGVRFGWVGVDSLYGSNAEFLDELEDSGEIFMADINKTTKLWTSEPKLIHPSNTADAAVKGRPRKWPKLHPRNTARYVAVGKLVEEQFATSHRELSYRQGQKGQLTTRCWAVPVWCWEKGRAKARQRMLIVRRDADDAYKYSLTNLTGSQTWEHYAWMQGQRFWIEHAFHEAKSQLGMAQYQVRVWKGWHHHISLVCLALLFTIKMRLNTRIEAPLLSTRDITELLDFYLPRKGLTEAEVLEQIRQRHRQRQMDIDRRRLHRPGLPHLTK